MTRRDLFRVLASIPGVSVLAGEAKPAIAALVTSPEPQIKTVTIIPDEFALHRDLIKCDSWEGWKGYLPGQAWFQLSGVLLSDPKSLEADVVKLELEANISPKTSWMYAATCLQYSIEPNNQIRISGLIVE